MKKSKNKLDEMQEQKLLHIEHNGVWLAFWGLFAAIIIQTAIGGENATRNLIGEWIVFICLSVYLVSACIKNGIWDRNRTPSLKNNVLYSLAAGLFVGVQYFGISYSNYSALIGSIFTAIFCFVSTFSLSLIVLSLSSAVFKKRYKKLETEAEKQSD